MQDILETFIIYKKLYNKKTTISCCTVLNINKLLYQHWNNGAETIA